MEPVGKLTKEEIENFKKCLKIARKVSGRTVDYSFIGIKDGKVHGTDGDILVSFVTEIYGEFMIHKKDAEILFKIGEGELQIDEERCRIKYISGKRGYVFDMHKEPNVVYQTAFDQLTGNGFNALLGDIKAGITFAKTLLKQKKFTMFLEANAEAQEINLFATSGEKNWHHTIAAKVKGDGLATFDSEVLERLLNCIPNKKIKLMFGTTDGEKNYPNPCVVNNDHVIAQFNVPNSGKLKMMASVFPTVQKFIND